MTVDLSGHLLDSPPGRLLTRAPSIRIDLWWVVSASHGPSLLYAWAIPRSAVSRTIGAHSNERKVGSQAVIAWTFEGPASELVAAMKRLLTGETLAATFSSIEHSAQIPAWTLPLSQLSPAPPSFQLTRDRYRELPVGGRTSPSPLEDALAYTASLVRLSKASVLAGFELEAVSLLEQLSDYVGFDFLTEHAYRLGNFEVLTFPSANAAERSGLDVSFGETLIHVTLDRSLLPKNGVMMVRCAEHAAGSILSDQVRALTLTEDTTSIDFVMSPDGPWTSYVDVWVGPGGDHALDLWASHVFIPMRSFTISTHVSGGRVAHAAWMQAWAQGDKITLSSSLTALVERERNAQAKPRWALAQNSARELLSTVSPPKRLDRFFPAGIDSATMFHEVMEKLTPSEATDILFLDPFIDGTGLPLLNHDVPRCLIHVLTLCLPQEHERKEHLQSAARAASAARGPLIEVGVLFVSDLSKRPGECYLLMLDGNGRALRGLQLSRGLCASNAHRPLLLNEIDSALLSQVTEYVRRIARGDLEIVGANARFVTLWPEPAPARLAVDVKPSPEQTAQALDGIPVDASNQDFDQWWEHAALLLANTSGGDELLARHESPGLVGRLVGLLGDAARLARLQQRARPATAASYFLLELVRSPLRMQYIRAWDLVVRWDVMPSWWPVLMAAEHLQRQAPAGLVEVLDRNLEPLMTDQSLGEQQSSRLDCVSTVLHVMARRLAHRRAPELEAPLLRARHRLLRAIGASAIVRRIVDLEYETYADDLKQLFVLGPEEHANVLGEAVYHLRVRANRSGRTESERDRQIRRSLFEILARLWEHLPSWEALVRRLDGPLLGTWCLSTTNELLMPLVEQDLLKERAVHDFWAGELCGRLQGMLDGSHHFYLDADAPLTQLVAALVARTWPETTALAFGSDVMDRSLQVIDRPFSRSVDYGRWDHAHKAAVWIRAFAQLLSVEAILDPRLDRLAAQELELLANHEDPSKLTWFARRIAEHTKRQGQFPAVRMLTLLASESIDERHRGYELASEAMAERDLGVPERVRKRLIDLALTEALSLEERGHALDLLRRRALVDSRTRRHLLTEWAFIPSSTVFAREGQTGPVYNLLIDDPESVDDLLELVAARAPPARAVVAKTILAMQSLLSADSRRVGHERALRWHAYAVENAAAVDESVLADIARMASAPMP